MNIIGISAYYHDSAAALIRDGEIVSAAQEERFTRKKHDPAFPENAIRFCLEKNALSLTDIDHIVFYDKPLLKFERLLETYVSYAPKGFGSFLMSMPVWLKEKLYLKTLLKKELVRMAGVKTKEIQPLLFTEHHLAHAASAFYPSPFEKAVVLCMDGVGEWATTSVWTGRDNILTPQWEINFPHSLGLLYSAFTYYTGFKVNSGEYKLMGLAPYGEPRYAKLILDNLIDVKPDGTFRLDMSFFNYATGLTMTNKKFDRLFGGPPRKAESEISQKEMDIAASIQKVTEEIILKLAQAIHDEFKIDYLCLAGGVALNCVANGELLRKGIFKDIWIQPAAGDAGGAVGAALAVWHQFRNKPRHVRKPDAMQGSYLGPAYSNDTASAVLEKLGAKFTQLPDSALYPRVAEILAAENVVGWFQGAMEFGPRALGNRSIIGDPRSPKMQSVMNLKIKYRESFRPFAPAVLADRVQDFFELASPSPYMLIVADVQEAIRIAPDNDSEKFFGVEKLKQARSTLPAITHVDFSARVQTVDSATNPQFSSLLSAFNDRTGCPVLINTSFNVRGEPIVCTPEDAYRCFMRTEMDYLVINNLLLAKNDQPVREADDSWKEEFALD
jgi:carbamoyltransferase